jgi:hypothetical protein
MPEYYHLGSTEVWTQAILPFLVCSTLVFGILQYFGVFRLFTYGNAALAMLIGLPVFMFARFFTDLFQTVTYMNPNISIPYFLNSTTVFEPWFRNPEREVLASWTTPEYLLVFMGVAFLAIMFFAFRDPANPLVGNYNPNYSY